MAPCREAARFRLSLSSRFSPGSRTPSISRLPTRPLSPYRSSPSQVRNTDSGARGEPEPGERYCRGSGRTNCKALSEDVVNLDKRILRVNGEFGQSDLPQAMISPSSCELYNPQYRRRAHPSYHLGRRYLPDCHSQRTSSSADKR